MKKLLALSLLLTLAFAPALLAAARSFHGEGEVLSVDPVYSRVTIQHAPIKGFASGNETDFVVRSASLLKKISKSDLVQFDLEDNKGDVQIVKIERTGQAPPKEDVIPLGRAAQEVLEGAGTVVKTVASPIAPVGEVANAATDATTNTTGSVLRDADSKVSTKF